MACMQHVFAAISLPSTSGVSARTLSTTASMVMSAENRALCYFYRHPPPGHGAPMKWSAIAELVWNTDGTHPTANGVKNCVLSWTAVRQKRGRKVGWRKTTAADDKAITHSFHKARLPFGLPGHLAGCRCEAACQGPCEDLQEDHS